VMTQFFRRSLHTVQVSALCERPPPPPPTNDGEGIVMSAHGLED